MSKFFRKGYKRKQFLFIGIIMNTIRKWNRLVVNFYFTKILRHCTIGQQHKFLDQLMSLLTFFNHDTDRLIVFIQFKSYFLRRKADRTIFKAFISHLLSKIIQDKDLVTIQPIFSFNNFLYFFIGK